MVRGVEWAAHFRWPLFGLLLRRVGNIPIDRENAFSAMHSMRAARRRLAAGQSLVILPEAHRTMDGELLPFKRLPFHMARDAGVDIVPVGMSGLYSLKNKHSWKINGVRLLVAIGDVITRGEIAACSVDELRALTRQRIAQLDREALSRAQGGRWPPGGTGRARRGQPEYLIRKRLPVSSQTYSDPSAAMATPIGWPYTLYVSVSQPVTKSSMPVGLPSANVTATIL